MLSAVRMIRESILGVGWDRTSTRLGVAFLLVSAIFFAANFVDKAYVSFRVGAEKQQVLAQIAATTRRIDSDQKELAYLRSRAFYLQEARRYGYVRPGDIQLELSGNQAPAPAVPAMPPVKVAPMHPPLKHQSLLTKLLQAVVPGI